MIHKNWQELIKPTQLVVKPGPMPRAPRPSSPNRWSVASASRSATRCAGC